MSFYSFPTGKGYKKKEKNKLKIFLVGRLVDFIGI